MVSGGRREGERDIWRCEEKVNRDFEGFGCLLVGDGGERWVQVDGGMGCLLAGGRSSDGQGR